MGKTIFVFIGGYLPAQNYGGPVTSIANIVENLSDEFDFRIVTSNHDLNSNVPLKGIHDGWNDVNKAKVLYLENSSFKREVFEKILKEYDADLLYLSGIFNYKLNFPAYSAARKLHIPILLAPRGELCENALSFGHTKKILFISVIRLTGYFKNIVYQATSEEEQEAIRTVLHIKKEKIFQIPNLHGNHIQKINKEKKKGTLKILFLARIAKKKNLLFAINIVKQLTGNILFDIYGPIEDQDYWTECCEQIKTSPNNVKINYCGAVAPEEANKVYANYDCFFFPTLSENYGHVIVEAILADCPVIISEGTTPWDDINGCGGFTAQLNDKKKFTRILENLVSMDSSTYKRLCEQLKNYSNLKFEDANLKEEYTQMFIKITLGKK